MSDHHSTRVAEDPRNEREDFKKLIGIDKMIEFYVHTTEPRERDHFKAEAYIAPKKDFIAINTTIDSPEASYNLIEHIVFGL